MKRWFFVPLGLLLFGIITSFAATWVVIDSLLPNTADDTNLEYIEIADITCFDLDLSGYELRDASGKAYLLSGTISSGAKKRIGRSESKIILNNTDERIDLLDASGALIDQFSYSASTKDLVISTGHYVLPVCQQSDPAVSASSGSGVEASGSLEISSGSTVLADSESQLSDSGASLSGSTSMDDGSASSIGVLDATGPISETGSLSDTWTVQPWADEIVVQTGSMAPIDASGSVESSGTSTGWGVQVFSSGSFGTGSFASTEAQKLILEDLDSNGKIDRISVLYDWMLTGTLDPSKLVLYSATGGLSGSRIESSTGIIQSLSLSGQILIIDLFEGDIEHPNLEINATTSSHLRLKTYSGFGLWLSDGREADTLTYTKSFHAYSGAYIENRAYVAPPPVMPTPVANAQPLYSPIPQNTSTILSHPLSDPTFAIQSWLTDRYECRSEPCKANLAFSPKYAYERCNWVFEWGTVDPHSLTSCNPKTVEFSPGDHDITLYVFEEGNPSNEISRTIRITGKKPALALEKEPMKARANPSSLPEIRTNAVRFLDSVMPETLHSAFERLSSFGASVKSQTKQEPKLGKIAETKAKTVSKSSSKKTTKTASGKTKRTAARRPKILAKRKTTGKRNVAESKPPQSAKPEYGNGSDFSASDRAAAASGLAVLASAGGYAVGRRRKSPCDAGLAS